jgi:solute carrier family 8 (sodium/calcium exchanger)
LTKKNLARFIKDVRRVDPSLSDEDAACLAATYIFENETHSRLFYRVSACRQMSGSKAPMPHLSQHLQDVYSLWKHSDPKVNGVSKKKDKESGGGDQANGTQVTTVDGNVISMAKTVAAEHAEDKNIAVVQFSAPTAIVMENAGKVEIAVRRYGKMDISFKCMIETLDRTAKADIDYKAVKEEITFAEHEREKIIDVEIIDDKNWNPDKVFLVKLSLDQETDERPDVAKGRMCLMTVTIVDDDEPGTISFTHRLYTVTEADGKAILPLQREGGADGQILLRYKTVDGSAKNGRDFRGGDGIVIFMHGVTEANIEIPITNDLDEERDEYFEVVLVSADNGAKIGKMKRAMVTVTNDDEYNSAMGKLLNKVRINRDNMRLHGEAWREQFLSAVKVRDEDDDDEEGGGEARVSAGDYILHVMSFFWKVLFAIVPPVGLWGGWCAFIASLIGIGILTAIVGDVAGTFGCLIGLPKSVNAITFVAMGTSLPDLFASRTAARMESTADNAIGNVTGSNSVNVFLGLGLPWLVASIYWHVQGKPFEVPAGSLGFSVGIFTGVALIATGVLLARRSLPIFGRGELGGPPAASWGCAILFCCLWLIYCTLSALQSYGVIAA